MTQAMRLDEWDQLTLKSQLAVRLGRSWSSDKLDNVLAHCDPRASAGHVAPGLAFQRAFRTMGSAVLSRQKISQLHWLHADDLAKVVAVCEALVAEDEEEAIAAGTVVRRQQPVENSKRKRLGRSRLSGLGRSAQELRMKELRTAAVRYADGYKDAAQRASVASTSSVSSWSSYLQDDAYLQEVICPQGNAFPFVSAGVAALSAAATAATAATFVAPPVARRSLGPAAADVFVETTLCEAGILEDPAAKSSEQVHTNGSLSPTSNDGSMHPTSSGGATGNPIDVTSGISSSSSDSVVRRRAKRMRASRWAIQSMMLDRDYVEVNGTSTPSMDAGGLGAMGLGPQFVVTINPHSDACEPGMMTVLEYDVVLCRDATPTRFEVVPLSNLLKYCVCQGGGLVWLFINDGRCISVACETRQGDELYDVLHSNTQRLMPDVGDSPAMELPDDIVLPPTSPQGSFDFDFTHSFSAQASEWALSYIQAIVLDLDLAAT
eukprot:m.199510 g.199510  ORF g.199510 m.199510 type:complete len:491 (-) comp18388_c2_seq2:46-1518(-)